jgi:hypothetical protein
MSAIVLVENERTAGGKYDHWQDVTGERYQFPNQYRNRVKPGVPFVYYRGTRAATGRRSHPEYFGHGVIGSVGLDPTSDLKGPKNRWKWICEISEYWPFTQPVPFKIEGEYIEKIPQNHWSVAVRSIDEDVFRRILHLAGQGFPTPKLIRAHLNLPDIDSVVPGASGGSLFRETQEIGNRNGYVSRRSAFSQVLGERGERIVLRYLEAILTPDEADTLRWPAKEGETPGYDLAYKREGVIIGVEVKATSGNAIGSLELTGNEWKAAKRMRDRYYLALVANVTGTNPSVEMIRDPYGLAVDGVLAADATVWRLRRPLLQPNLGPAEN